MMNWVKNPELAMNDESPEYAALITCVPAARLEVNSEASPLLRIEKQVSKK